MGGRHGGGGLTAQRLHLQPIDRSAGHIPRFLVEEHGGVVGREGHGWEVVQEGKLALVGSPTHLLRFWARAYGARGTYMAGGDRAF